MANDEKITNDEMNEALLRSGYLLESRLLKILSDFDYTLHPNDVYPDPSTNKSREIDIFGISPRQVVTLSLDRKLIVDIQHNIIIECSNNPQPAVFFRRTDKKKFTIFGKFKFNKIEQEPNENSTSADFEFHTFTTESNLFHYNNFQRCSQYCSFALKKSSTNNKKEWFATHPDGLHDVFNKLYDFVNHTFQSNQDWIQTGVKNDDVYANLYFPVIVLQGDLYEAIEEDGKVNLTKVNHTIYEFIRYENDSRVLLIDIITEEYFPEYIKLLNNNTLGIRDLYINYYKGKTLLDQLPF